MEDKTAEIFGYKNNQDVWVHQCIVMIIWYLSSIIMIVSHIRNSNKNILKNSEVTMILLIASQLAKHKTVLTILNLA